ncbi:hypothetical protein DYB28_004774, partial [Aphanomyces astaci]
MRKSARQSEKSASSRSQQLQHLQNARRAALGLGVNADDEEEDNDEVEWHPDDEDESSVSSGSEDDEDDQRPSHTKPRSGNLTRKRSLHAMQDGTISNDITAAAKRRERTDVTVSSNPKDPRQRRQAPVKSEPTIPRQEKNPKDPRQRRAVGPRATDQPSSTNVKVALPIYTDSSDEDEVLLKKPKSILKRSQHTKSQLALAPPSNATSQVVVSGGIGWAGSTVSQTTKPLALHKRPNRQRQAQLLRPVMSSSNALSQFYEDIMDWDVGAALVQDAHPSATAKQPDKSSCDDVVPSTFESFEHYFDVWKPLAVQEVHAQSINGLSSDLPPALPVTTRTNVLATVGVSTIKVSVLINRGANPTKKQLLQLDDIRKDDLVLLTPDNTYLTRRMRGPSKPDDMLLTASCGILGIVDSQRSSREGLVVVVTSKKWRELSGAGHKDAAPPLFVFKLNNLVTSFREFRALCQCREYKLMPLLLSGKAQPPSTKLDSLGMAYVQWLRKTFNESQQEAIAAAATSHGFTLIKGPPGTGKTTTLKGLLNSLHLREYNRYYNAVLDVARRPDHETSKAWAAIGDEKPHILVAAPSNIAVDNIVAKIMEEGFCDGEGRQYFPNIIRVGRGAVRLTGTHETNVNVKSVVLEGMVESLCSQPQEAVEMRCRQLQHELSVVCTNQTSSAAPPDATPAALAVYRSDSEDDDAAHVPFSCDEVTVHVGDDDLDEDETDEPFVPVEGDDESDEVDEPFVNGATAAADAAAEMHQDADEEDVDEPLVPVDLAAGSAEDGECSDIEPPPPPPSDSGPSPPPPSDDTVAAIPRLPPSHEPVIIDYNAYKPYKDMAQRINLCLERFHSLKLELQRYAMVRRSMEAHGRVVKETQDTLESSFLESAHIVFTTLSSAGHRALDDSSRYDILVIDEAAQAVELSTIIPMRYEPSVLASSIYRISTHMTLVTRFGSRQCVLVGDPQQLSATVFSRTSAQSLYERSLFERLESCGHPVHMLRTHHPTISAFPRQYFYGGLLQDGDNVRQPTYAKMYHGLAPAFKPLVFWNLVSSREAMSSMSRTNPMEVKLAVNLYLTLRNSCPPDAIRGKVGVITPYAAQMDELKRAFTIACNGEFHHDVEINTVDGYQGREKDIIIRTLNVMWLVSTVRSDPRKGVGFLNDIRRMNVALTRAKFACYVLGSEAALQNSTPWAALLDHARGTGCLVNVPNPQENLFTLVPAPPGPPRGVSPPRIDAGADGEAADEEAVDEGDLADVEVVKATNRLIRNTTPLRTNSTNSFHIPHTNNSRNPHTTHLHPP